MNESKKTRAGFSREFLALVFVILLIGLLIAISIFVMSHGTASKNSCINNLRQIDGAKEQWALANKKSAGTPTIASEVDAYIEGGAPKCEDGGTYTYGAVGEAPKCSMALSMRGHSL